MGNLPEIKSILSYLILYSSFVIRSLVLACYELIILISIDSGLNKILMGFPFLGPKLTDVTIWSS